MKSNIVLIGFMGSGKTTIGKILSKELDMEMMDTDSLIEEKAGMSVSDIFEKFGEKKFRDIETEMAQYSGNLTNRVIATGGGIVLKPENIEFLKKKGIMVLLWASPDNVYDRLKDKNDRPLLKVENPKEKIKELLDFRERIYKEAADYIIDTDGIGVDEITQNIKKIYLNT